MKRIWSLLAAVLLIQLLSASGLAAGENTDTLEDWGIRIALPDNTISVLDEEDGNYYIYAMEYDSIPYVMVRTYSGFASEREFVQSYFTDYMRENYGDLAVTSELRSRTVGGRNCYEIDYSYSVSGYAVRDRRILINAGGVTYMFASKEVDELGLTVGDMLEEVVAGSVFLSEESGPAAGTAQSEPPAASAPTAFMLTRIEDIDSGATMARCYAPADYHVSQILFAAGDGSAASPACPYQIFLEADSPDNEINMAYESELRFLYPEGSYQEGQLYYFIETMLRPMSAAEYADYRMQSIYSSAGDIYLVDSREASDQDNEWLADRAGALWDYYSTGSASMAGITYDAVSCTYAERLYTFDAGISYTTRIITATDRIQYTQSMGMISETCVETVVPYFYICTAPTEIFDSVAADFDLFVLNTRASDEFDLMRMNVSIQLCAAISNGTTMTIDDDDVRDMLGTDYGTYDTEQFCDYILGQNSYTTSEGKDVKISTAYDYVYEGADGNIYATDSADAQPAGSTRLYAH